ncbi:hypothetical protein SEA_COLUCCI_81 [Arthrobacter phage Colucci]|uniref:Uncharacterized protein n=1 Tax=Arthrobacter phage Colucci TaxID=2015834 RepID=A0A286N2Z3_9CAUD|nr:hypothetical protein FDI27_gp081 [Arthrobacter phage Colucci]ASX98750.1 hypothetical protein SEA_COLUCCI_81 [Arthrobacter phage Colucci]
MTYQHPVIDFLEARLEEQEALAKTCLLPEHTHPYGDERIPASRPDQWARDLDNYLGGPYGKHTGYWSPTQVLAEIHTKREVIRKLRLFVEQGKESPVIESHSVGLLIAVKLLCQPYQDHPDFRQIVDYLP